MANELFSAIAAIAVDRARRQGLAIVHEAIANGVCRLEFDIPKEPIAAVPVPPVPPAKPASSVPLTLRLADTCTLVRTTDLIALVGQGRALRSALTSDVLSAADAVVVDRLSAFPPWPSKRLRP